MIIFVRRCGLGQGRHYLFNPLPTRYSPHAQCSLDNGIKTRRGSQDLSSHIRSFAHNGALILNTAAVKQYCKADTRCCAPPSKASLTCNWNLVCNPIMYVGIKKEFMASRLQKWLLTSWHLTIRNYATLREGNQPTQLVVWSAFCPKTCDWQLIKHFSKKWSAGFTGLLNGAMT